MNNFFLVLAVSIIIAALFLSFYLRREEEPQPVTFEMEPPPQPREPAPEPPPPVEFPVPEVAEKPEEPPKPLPSLDESDASVEQEFNELVGDRQHSDLLLFKTFIRNFVVIVDNLTERILPQKYYFFHPPPGNFLVTRTGDEKIFLDPRNYGRYTPFTNLVKSLDINRLTQVYRYLYPLFQEAYEELGYPDQYFNDRMIYVIDHLLQTPEVKDPVELVQPTVFYKFANPELEALSAGQKLLIRVGPENSAVIRGRLAALRKELTSLGGSGQEL